MIDLHMHSTNSDGSDSVIELLKKAESKGLDYISITDHDNCNGYEELETINPEKYFHGKIIPGIEIKCSYGKNLIEILGYQFDIKKMKQWTAEYYKDKSREILQTKYFNIQYEKAIQMGLIMDQKEKINWDAKNGWASVTIYNEIKRHPENQSKVPEDLWSEFDVFSKKYCGNQSYPLFIDKTPDYPTAEETVHIIKECGGLVFLPHLFIYKWAKNKYQLIDDILEKYDIDGIECMHSTFSNEQIQYLVDLCNERNYFKSGGSDYHGKNKPNIDMGCGKGNLRIPNEWVEEWVK